MQLDLFRVISVKNWAIEALVFCTFLAGCNNDRLAKLERENSDLRANLEKQNAAAAYDLQAKCAKDARIWFNLNWAPRDKNTIYLDYTNHYNRKLNGCFIVVEHHFNLPQTSNWHNAMSLWNVHENEQYGTFDEGHYYDSRQLGDGQS